jgi:hypothetical protein
MLLVALELLAGCATPATQVKVPTMTVEQAWRARTTQDYAVGPSTRIMKPAGQAVAPFPIISAPNIRLAYIKPWKDESGNYHYGHWVAIQIESPKWLLPDGTVDPIDGRGAQSAPARP